MSGDTDKRLLLISETDNIVMIKSPIEKGESILLEGHTVDFTATLGIGHKLARRAISPGEKVLKYGAPIGTATTFIKPGEHVHLHNLKSDYTVIEDMEAP